MSTTDLRPLSWSETDDLAVNTIRILSADMVEKANSGHPGMPMGFALPAHVLWTRFLKFNPDNPFWPARDRFLLSCGHGSALLYSLLHLAGYDLTIDDIKDFRQWESKTPGHPEFGQTSGVETTAGPLGQGVGIGVGMAMANRYIKECLEVKDGDFNPLDHFMYVVASDGDLQEGISGESSSLAGVQKLGNLIVLYDDNGISIDGGTEISWCEDVPKRYQAYGWHTVTADGTDPESIYNAILEARHATDKPSLISVKTHIGFGSPAKQDTSGAHGAPLGAEELAATKKALGWKYEPFEIPGEAYTAYVTSADIGRDAHEEWLKTLGVWLSEDTTRDELWEELIHGKLPEGIFNNLPEFEAGKKIATRAAFGDAFNAIASNMKGLFGGNADLAGSVKAVVKGAGSFLPTEPGGRNINFGIREHAMGAAAIGMSLYAGIKPYTGTFFTFSDYMRPSIRLAALMNLQTLFVFSHDSIGVGEDGPTHQPIEHFAAIRTIPNVHVYRPGDAAETAYSLKMALERTEGPTSILTTRQGLPVIDRSKYAEVDGVAKGGYVLADCNGTPELIFIATGSELSLAIEAHEQLAAEGIKTRVISLPCWEKFSEQSVVYRNSVIDPTVKARVGVEVGISFGWERWIGDYGQMMSIDRFGGSGPASEVFKALGITLENLVSLAKETLASVK